MKTKLQKAMDESVNDYLSEISNNPEIDRDELRSRIAESNIPQLTAKLIEMAAQDLGLLVTHPEGGCISPAHGITANIKYEIVGALHNVEQYVENMIRIHQDISFMGYDELGKTLMNHDEINYNNEVHGLFEVDGEWVHVDDMDFDTRGKVLQAVWSECVFEQEYLQLIFN